MALTMGQLKKLLEQTVTTGTPPESAVAQLVAEALLRSAGRQAIIAAAADAVAQLGCGDSTGVTSRSLQQLITSLPGGPIGEETGGEGGGGNSGTGPR